MTKNSLKMTKLKNANATFWIIFKHCVCMDPICDISILISIEWFFWAFGIYVLDCNTIMAFCQWCTFNAKSPLLLCRRLIHAFLTMSTRTLLQKRATLQLQNFSNFTLLHRWCYHTVFENRPKKSHLKLSILSGQKLNKNAKNGSYWRVFENLNSVTRQVNYD